MSRRFRSIFRIELRRQLTRPLFWVLVVVTAVFAWGLSTGGVRISSGASQVGGTKAWITSQFAVAQLLSLLTPLLYGFFIAVAAGMTVLQDEESKVEPILHSTPLRPWEYVWGKLSATLLAYTIALGGHLSFTVLFNHLLPAGESAEFRGPFALSSYLVPALAFSLPLFVFIGGVSFAVGAIGRRPIAVFFLPTAMLLVSVFFIWEWSPGWLDPRIDRLLILADPAGFRWLNNTWLKVDRGVDFYNHASIPFDWVFWANRALFVGTGLAALVFAQGRLARVVRGAETRGARRRLAAAVEEPAPPSATASASPFLPLETKVVPPGFLRGARLVAVGEGKALATQPGLYLFVPLILLQTLGSQFWAVGPFDMPLLVTSGTIAAGTFDTLSLLLSFLLLFYTVESLERERRVGLAPLFDSSPIRSGSVLLGKALANALVAATILGAAFLGAILILLIQGKVPVDPRPFLLVWGLLLLPGLFLWSSFVAALHAATRNRYATWGLGLALLALSGILQIEGKINWASSWNLWGIVRWSDIACFELDRTALVLNRLAALALAAFFVALTVRFHPRRESDSGAIVDRLRPASLGWGALRLLPWAALPIVLVTVLGFLVAEGPEGAAAKKRAKDYWAKNVESWKDAPLPSFERVDLDVVLEPATSSFHVKGSYSLVNRLETPLRQFPLTTGDAWKNVHWTVDGKGANPEERKLLWIFTPPAPLAPGAKVIIGFEYDGSLPSGISKNGGGAEQFVLPSSVVLTCFEPTFVPVLGFVEGIGIDPKENKTDPKEYPDDFYLGRTPPELGTGLPFDTRIRVTAPADLQVNSVGVLESSSVANGKRTVVYASDRPVQFFNVVAGRWKVSEGKGTRIHYDPRHAVNVPEMQKALDASRARYSEWFAPYPWKELKLSEFAGLAMYAQGFPTNITFSEAIGFLAKDDPRVPAPFMVTAHEAAHQWWGNLLVPGKGPGGVILAEGMSHYSALLLIEAEKGAMERSELAKRFEERYARNRQVDSERPLVKTDASRAGDNVVIYEKGGWVFWMLGRLMGPEAARAGLRDFIESWADSPDHPVLQDFLAVMRRHAPDPAAFDAFDAEWFRQVVVPEYRIAGAKRTKSGTGWLVTATVENAGTGRMPVDLAAVKGERFEEPKEGKASAVSKGWREARTRVTLGPGEKGTISIAADFEPDRLVVDPDVQVLQLQREKALARF